MTDPRPLLLFNSLTRQLETFQPVHPGEARVYSCGPTVYNYPHIGNMRAYVFADVLGRTLSHKGYALMHVINITDVGHLTDDADAGEDKMEKAAAARAQSIWDISRHYTQAYWADIAALNIRAPAHWSIATEYVPQMIEFAQAIAPALLRIAKRALFRCRFGCRLRPAGAQPDRGRIRAHRRSRRQAPSGRLRDLAQDSAG
jgi:cysteinyl-tRNA synthetase